MPAGMAEADYDAQEQREGLHHRKESSGDPGAFNFVFGQVLRDQRLFWCRAGVPVRPDMGCLTGAGVRSLYNLRYGLAKRDRSWSTAAACGLAQDGDGKIDDCP